MFRLLGLGMSHRGAGVIRRMGLRAVVVLWIGIGCATPCVAAESTPPPAGPASPAESVAAPATSATADAPPSTVVPKGALPFVPASVHGPVIDMHVHAFGADAEGPPGQVICTPYPKWPANDPGRGGVPAYLGAMFGAPDCPAGVRGALTDDELRTRTLAMLREHNVWGLTGGTPAFVSRWHADEPRRVLPAVGGGLESLPPPDEIRRLHGEGRVLALAEIVTQYAGVAPTDPRLAPYWALAEELDIPVGIHMGPGPPGVTYFGAPGYRMALSDPLQLEDILDRHPKLRVFVVHAGWPMRDRMIALMYAHPQVYAEIGILPVAYPDSAFHPYLQALVDAGFEDRILFGSDQMVWPELIQVAIARVWQAPGLSRAQKRKILYDNAARFLRIDPARTGVLEQGR